MQAVNSAMVQTYWEIGRLIVEDEQNGRARAEYGKEVLQGLSRSLRDEFGKGFDVRNLRNMRSFYLAVPNRNAVRTELSWTHYRTLLRLENQHRSDKLRRLLTTVMSNWQEVESRLDGMAELYLSE